MVKIISIHSFRGGTGKSNITANVASHFAQRGLKVGIVDADIQSPGIHRLFERSGKAFEYTLNNYIWGDCGISKVIYDVSDTLPADVDGQIFLMPSSMNAGEIARILKEKYNDRALRESFKEFIKYCDLDVLMIDTHPGINEETLISLAISNNLGIVMRPDNQDFEGTAVTVEIARKLKVSNLSIIINKLPSVFDEDEVRHQVEDNYQCVVSGIVPHSDDLMVLSSDGVFSLRYPDHPLTQRFKQIADYLLQGE